MSKILYSDPQVIVYQDLIVINKYYFPLATSKTIMFDDIQSAALVSAQGISHRWGITTQYLNNWFPYDGKRKDKKHFIELKLKGRKIKPSITPDDVDTVFRIIWENHTPEGQKYAEEMSKHSEKESQMPPQEVVDRKMAEQSQMDLNTGNKPEKVQKAQKVEPQQLEMQEVKVTKAEKEEKKTNQIEVENLDD